MLPKIALLRLSVKEAFLRCSADITPKQRPSLAVCGGVCAGTSAFGEATHPFSFPSINGNKMENKNREAVRPMAFKYIINWHSHCNYCP
jgi:hypothetical protein